jgi:hypothetical protein
MSRFRELLELVGDGVVCILTILFSITVMSHGQRVLTEMVQVGGPVVVLLTHSMK